MDKAKNDNVKDIIKMFAILAVTIAIFVTIGALIVNKIKPNIQTEYSNGYTFTKTGGFWHTTVRNPSASQDYNLDFRYSPSEVNDVIVNGNPRLFFNLLQDNNLTGAYFTFDPTAQNLTSVNLAAADLSKYLKVINGITLVAACTKNETVACHTRPIVTCENQLNKSVVIYAKQSTIPAISLSKNCLTIEGTNEGMVKAYTKLLFYFYNII